MCTINNNSSVIEDNNLDASLCFPLVTNAFTAINFQTPLIRGHQNVAAAAVATALH